MAVPRDTLRQHCCMEYARTKMVQLTLALLLVLALLQGLEPNLRLLPTAAPGTFSDRPALPLMVSRQTERAGPP
jgi:hypothetical protein